MQESINASHFMMITSFLSSNDCCWFQSGTLDFGNSPVLLIDTIVFYDVALNHTVPTCVSTGTIWHKMSTCFHYRSRVWIVMGGTHCDVVVWTTFSKIQVIQVFWTFRSHEWPLSLKNKAHVHCYTTLSKT